MNKYKSSKKLLLSLLLFLSGLNLYSQSNSPETTDYRYWIYFKDKGVYKKDVSIEPGTDAYKVAIAELSDKAIWRRGKVLPASQMVSYDDLPVNPEYINQIKELGFLPNAVSKWFNAVSVFAKKDGLEKIKKLGFVEKIEGVHFLENVSIPSDKKVIENITPPDKINKYNYGLSYWQNEQIKVPELHNIGVTGFGTTVGMCDDGFAWRRHEALKNRRVLGEYDWIFKDDSVQNQVKPNQIPDDPYDQDGHGTATFSTLGGFANGKMIGPAFDADFWLSKTEFGATETPVEEDFWLAAVEWMESKGVEVISSSLIYKPFDKPNNVYDYKDMDGKTTVIVRAAEHCAYLGIVVCNSMGNEYQTNPPSIVSPPDGDSVVAVGAVDSTGRIAVFSSNGPTSDGRMKPDIVALGVDAWACMSYHTSGDDTTYQYISGTSFSCPITAGVCSLILSVHPELTPMQVKEALKNTADKKDTPNNVYGWGLINAYNAALYFGIIMSNKPEMKTENGSLSFSINIASKNPIDHSSVKMFYSTDGGIEFTEAKNINADYYEGSLTARVFASLPESTNPDGLRIYFSASDSQKSITAPYNAPQKYFYINNDTKKVEIY